MCLRAYFTPGFDTKAVTLFNFKSDLFLCVPNREFDKDLDKPLLDKTSNSPSLKQRLLAGAAWLGVGRICSIGAFLAADVLLGRTLPEQDFAAYLTATATAIMLATLVCFGTPKMLIRALKQQLQRGDIMGARAAMRSCFGTIAMIASLVLLVFLVGSNYVGSSPEWRGLRDYSLLVAGWACLSAACLVSAHALQAIDDFRSAVLVGARNGGVIANVLFVSFAFGAYQLGLLNLKFALASQVVFNSLALIVAVASIRRGFRKIEQQMTVSDDSVVESENNLPNYGARWFLLESWPNFIVQITSMSIVELQILLVGLLCTEREIADYGVVLRLLSVVYAAQALVTTALAPFVAELIAHKRLIQLERILRGSATLVAIPTLLLTAIFITFPEHVLSLTFGPEFVGGDWSLRIISVGCAIGILSGSNGLTMIMSGRQYLLMTYSVLASVLYLMVAVGMIQAWGIVGAAISVSLVFGVYNVWVTLLVRVKVGVWTVPTLSPRNILATINELLGRRRTH